MAKGSLIKGLGTFGTIAGVTVAATIALVEILNAGLGILYDRSHVDGRTLLGQAGDPGAGIGLFFDQLRTEFDTLARLTPLPGAEMSLIFAGISVLAAYLWLERARLRVRAGILPLVLLAVTVLPLLVCIVDLVLA